MAALTDEEIAEAVTSVDPATRGFQFQQTMIRVKDPKKSLKFYTEVLGMRLIHYMSMPAMKFTVYFLAFENEEDIPKDPEERKKFCFSGKGYLELTHNWGTETDETQKYHNGNTEPRGFVRDLLCQANHPVFALVSDLLLNNSYRYTTSQQAH